MTDIESTLKILDALQNVSGLSDEIKTFIEKKKADAPALIASGASAWGNIKDKTAPTKDELRKIYDVIFENSSQSAYEFDEFIESFEDSPKEDILTSTELYEWGRELNLLSPRVPGTDNMDIASKYICEKLNLFGIESSIEPLNFKGVFFHEWSFGIESPFKKNYTAFPQNNVAFGDVTSEIVYIGNGYPEDYVGKDVKGKLLLMNLNGIMEHEGPCIVRERYGLLALYDTAYINEAAGIVGFFTDTPGNTLRLLEPGIKPMGGSNISGPSEIGEDNAFALPVLNIGKEDAEEIIEVLKKDKVEAHLKISGVRKVSTTPINIGYLPGKSEKIIAVASHSCTAFEGAVCDTGGVVGTLALAKYFASLPIEQREKSMLFIFDSFHVWGNCCQAAQTVLSRHTQYAKNIEAFLWLDHLTDGSCDTSRVVNVSDNSVLWPLTSIAVAKGGIAPIVLPIAQIWSICATGSFERLGIPTMTMQITNDYLLSPDDTWDRFDENILYRDIMIHVRLALAIQKIEVPKNRPQEPVGGCGALFTELKEPEYPEGESYIAEKAYPLYVGGSDFPVQILHTLEEKKKFVGVKKSY